MALTCGDNRPARLDIAGCLPLLTTRLAPEIAPPYRKSSSFEHNNDIPGRSIWPSGTSDRSGMHSGMPSEPSQRVPAPGRVYVRRLVTRRDAQDHPDRALPNSLGYCLGIETITAEIIMDQYRLVRTAWSSRMAIASRYAKTRATPA